ncbi:hypothetical protein COOONC_20885 [Cooperia oncophora]
MIHRTHICMEVSPKINGKSNENLGVLEVVISIAVVCSITGTAALTSSGMSLRGGRVKRAATKECTQKHIVKCHKDTNSQWYFLVGWFDSYVQSTCSTVCGEAEAPHSIQKDLAPESDCLVITCTCTFLKCGIQCFIGRHCYSSTTSLLPSSTTVASTIRHTAKIVPLSNSTTSTSSGMSKSINSVTRAPHNGTSERTTFSAAHLSRSTLQTTLHTLPPISPSSETLFSSAYTVPEKATSVTSTGTGSTKPSKKPIYVWPIKPLWTFATFEATVFTTIANEKTTVLASKEQSPSHSSAAVQSSSLSTPSSARVKSTTYSKQTISSPPNNCKNHEDKRVFPADPYGEHNDNYSL